MNLCDSCLFSAVSRLETVHFGGHGELFGCWKKRRSAAHVLNSSLRGRRWKQSGCGFVSSLKVSYEVCRAYEPLRKGVGDGKGFEEPGSGEPSEASEVLNWRSRGVDEVGLKQKLEKGGLESVNGERVHKYPPTGGKRPDMDSTDFEEVGGAAKSSEEDFSDDYLDREDDFEGSDMKISKIRGPGGKQVMRRSSMLAKQVISIQSAHSLGFVSQLWVDTRLV